MIRLCSEEEEEEEESWPLLPQHIGLSVSDVTTMGWVKSLDSRSLQKSPWNPGGQKHLKGCPQLPPFSHGG